MATQSQPHSASHLSRVQIEAIVLTIAMLIATSFAVIAHQAAVAGDDLEFRISPKAQQRLLDRPSSLRNGSERATSLKSFYHPQAGEGLLGLGGIDDIRIPASNVDRADALHTLKQPKTLAGFTSLAQQRLMHMNMLPGDSPVIATPSVTSFDRPHIGLEP